MTDKEYNKLYDTKELEKLIKQINKQGLVPMSQESIAFIDIRKAFKEMLEKDTSLLIGYHSNVAMFLQDNIIVENNHLLRNDMACKMLKLLFDIDYSWRKLLNSEHIYIDEGVIKP